MSGYGSPDDEQERAQIRVDERIALARSLLPSGPGTLNCDQCHDPIPEARRKAMLGTTHCVDCQSKRDDNKPSFKEPWAT